MVKELPKATRLEIVGAWLGIWTPPRDAQIPPVPWRRLAIGAAAILVVGGAAIAISAPLIDAAKDRSAAREQRGLDERRAARRERIRREQVPRTGTATGSRAEVLAAVAVAIGADARARFNPKARPATCEPAPGKDPAADRVAYDCLSAVRDIVGAGEQKGAHGVLGIPFRAVVDFDRHRYAFCKVNPPPGEQVIPDPRDIVALPEACEA